MSLLWHYLKNYKKLLGLALVLAAVNQIFSLLDPQIFRIIIDKYASKADQLSQRDFLLGIVYLLLASMLVAFVSRVAKNFQDYYVNVIVQRLGAAMYNHSVEHSFSLPFAVFEDERSGEFLNKLQKARDDSQKLITLSINVLFLALIGILFVISYAFFVHWLIGFVYFLIIPAMGLATFFISKNIKTAQSRVVKETSALAGSTTETLRNVELVKSLGLESQEIERLNSVNEQILSLELRKVKMVRRLSFLQGTLINALRSALLLLMLYLISQGDITLGQFFSLLFYSFFIFNPLGELGNLATAYQETRASMNRLQKILDTPKEEVPASPVSINKVRKVAFQNVAFHYASSPDTPALMDVSFELASGSTVAFVGPSGSGKSTVIKLLVGLYPATSGRITINDMALSDIHPSEYRSRLGFVSQGTQLFAGTIRDNLRFVKPAATDAEMLAALQGASATKIIERGGLSLETRIGEGGLKLSGGEKQRLSIARALLRQPDMIIFDEATSSLDSLTEAEITETIKQIKVARPELITALVAHRLSTVMHADTIHVLEQGRISESGTHAELLNKAGLYSALWRQQIAAKE